uniref:Galectin domain-containing protein n=1 Tax=Globodera rostochiensis TaxID=31243 RepID=A0A914HU20_GLORO
MNAHLALNFFCLLALLHGAQSQMKTKPTHLTGRIIKNHTIPVAPLDQCFPYGDESRAFGLEFRIPLRGGRCDRGMLICYPSVLASNLLPNKRNVNGLSVNSELFNVDSAVKNTLAKQCASLVSNEEKEIIWHGIKVATKKIYETGKLYMKVSTSLLGEGNGYSFDIYPFREFVLHFGNEREFVTYVTIDGGEPVEVEGEKAKREAYKQLAPRGARLKDFVGLWTLGLDMLPWMTHTMRLHVSRSCDCTMDAWFIRPTDSETKDVDASRGSPGINCKASGTNKTVPLNHAGNKTFFLENTLILIRTLTSEDIKSATFEIPSNHSNEDVPLMKFTITNENAIIYVRERDSNELSNSTTNIANLSGKNGSQIDFMIACTNYSYIIMMEKIVVFGNEIFPPKWWQGLPFEKINRTHLLGQFLVLTIPQVMLFVSVQQNFKPPQMPNPYNETVLNLQNGSTNLLDGSNLIFRVKPRNPNAYTFNILLLHDRPEEHPTIGATVLKLQVNRNKAQNQNELVLTSFTVDGKENKPSIINIPSGVFVHKLLEVNIKVFSNHYMFMMNGEKLPQNHTAYLPIWATNYVRVEGDAIKLLGVPCVYVPEKIVSKSNSDITVKLNTLLNYDDTITIDAYIYKPTHFSILFMHESMERDPKIGDVVLEVAFDFKTSDSNKANSAQCKSFIHADNETKTSNRTDHNLNKRGQTFKISIISEQGHFRVEIVDIKFNLNCPYPNPNKRTVPFPPWAVDHIRIEGDVQVHGLSILHAPPSPELAIKKIIGTLRSNDSINVHVKVPEWLNNDNFKVTVNLFNEALKQHELVGKTVMSMTFNKPEKVLGFSSHDNGKTQNEQNDCNFKHLNLKLPLKTPTPYLDFEIRVMDAGFKVTVNNNTNKPCTYNGGLPKWAVKYITVEHPHGNTDLKLAINCVPAERCIEPNSGTEKYL